ncbi:MAG: hypothetical protein ACJA0V_001897 [Planctomycetota bacterium]|jgi:hypothetical protein
MVSLGKATVGEATVGEVTVGESTAGEATVGESTAGEATVGEATVGEATVGEATAGEAPATDYDLVTRSTYSPVRVSMRTVSSRLMNTGTISSAPVETVAGFCTLPVELPLAPGSV